MNFTKLYNFLSKVHLSLCGNIAQILSECILSPSACPYLGQRKQSVVLSIASMKNTSNLTSEDKRAITSINDDESITIVPADKGNTTVVIDTTGYRNKMDEHLSDQSTYIVVNEYIYIIFNIYYTYIYYF